MTPVGLYSYLQPTSNCDQNSSCMLAESVDRIVRLSVFRHHSMVYPLMVGNRCPSGSVVEVLLNIIYDNRSQYVVFSDADDLHADLSL